MIERQFIKKNKTELGVRDFIKKGLKSALVSEVHIQKTPLGEKITVYCARPGLVVGRKGVNIKQITSDLKEKFNIENPQLEISEVPNQYLNAKIVSSLIGNLFEQYGQIRFKGIAHKMIKSVMDAGAKGIEIRLSGTLPSDRSKVWRFYAGYLKKSGDVAVSQVDFSRDFVNLKRGTIGVVVKIMKGDVKLPDHITFNVLEEQIPESEAKKLDAEDSKIIDLSKKDEE